MVYERISLGICDLHQSACLYIFPKYKQMHVIDEVRLLRERWWCDDKKSNNNNNINEQMAKQSNNSHIEWAKEKYRLP